MSFVVLLTFDFTHVSAICYIYIILYYILYLSNIILYIEIIDNINTYNIEFLIASISCNIKNYNKSLHQSNILHKNK